MAHKVYIRKITGDWIKPKDISNALDWLEWHEIVPKDARVFIKPNLTWPEHLPGVTTTPKAIESVVIALLERTSNIYIGESDGGYHSYKAEEAFELHGLYELEKKFGISIFNLSKDEAVTNVLEIDGHNYKEIENAFLQAKNTRGKPTVIIAHTLKGKGISYMEGSPDWHGSVKLSKEDLETALIDLGCDNETIKEYIHE